MRREIKFRGKPYIKHTSQGPKTQGDFWVYGGIDNLGLGPIICNENDRFSVVPETVGQYTGVKDRNGKEIYEGDVVFDGEYTGLVWGFRDSACYTVVYSGVSVDLADDHPEMLEVVGNIFDVPKFKERFAEVLSE